MEDPLHREKRRMPGKEPTDLPNKQEPGTAAPGQVRIPPRDPELPPVMDPQPPSFI